jgi:hypothetical protein
MLRGWCRQDAGEPRTQPSSKRPWVCRQLGQWPQGQRKVLGQFEPVYHEVAVIGHVAEVASVGKGTWPARETEAMVGPLLYKPTLQAPVTPQDLPVLFQASRAIAHGVAVFGQNMRFREARFLPELC